MSNLVEHAKVELAKIDLKPDSKEEMHQLMYKQIIEIVELFASQGHSGFSANYALSVIMKLLRYEPITALTGEDAEWLEVDESVAGRKMWQNVRCAGRVIKEEDGKCYDLEGKIFRDKDGSTYTNRDSWVEITFPYFLQTEYVDVEK